MIFKIHEYRFVYPFFYEICNRCCQLIFFYKYFMLSCSVWPDNLCNIFSSVYPSRSLCAEICHHFVMIYIPIFLCNQLGSRNFLMMLRDGYLLCLVPMAV